MLKKISKIDKLLDSLIKNTEFKNEKIRDILQILEVLFYTGISIGSMNVYYSKGYLNVKWSQY